VVQEREVDRRWRQTFGSTHGTLGREVVRCPKCGRDVGPYVRKHGERWCPWCSVKLEDCNNGPYKKGEDGGTLKQ
jgi:hypothetical protein